MAQFDCDELLGKLKVRGQIPVASGTWTDAKLLEACSDEAETWLMPLMIRARGEYLVKTQDIAFVAGQADYRFNSRVAAIREVSRLMADGTVVPIEELSPAQQTGLRVIPSRQGVPSFYTFKEGVITLFPVPGGTGDSLRVKYHYRLNRMVPAAEAVVISGISVGATVTTLTVGSIPAAMTAIGQTVDFIRGTPIFDVVSFDVSPSSAWTTGNTSMLFLNAAVPSNLAVGDYVCNIRRTPVPNMPPELHICAGLRAAAAAVGSKGDRDSQKMLLQEAVSKEQSLLAGILEPRSRGNSRRLVSRRFR